jgi:hypothetical protein
MGLWDIDGLFSFSNIYNKEATKTNNFDKYNKEYTDTQNYINQKKEVIQIVLKKDRFKTLKIKLDNMKKDI